MFAVCVCGIQLNVFIFNFNLLVFPIYAEQSKVTMNETLTYKPNLNIAPEGTSYCYVVRPDQPKTMPPQHSKCAFPELYDASDANGKWSVITGIEGRTNEMNYEINVIATKTFGKVSFVDFFCIYFCDSIMILLNSRGIEDVF